MKHGLLLVTNIQRRDKVVKEELVVTMTTFLPVLLAIKPSTATSNDIRDRVDELYSRPEDDINNLIFDRLQLDSLRLHFHSKEHERVHPIAHRFSRV